MAHRINRKIQALPAKRLTSLIVTIVESRETNLEMKQWAYELWEDSPHHSGLPRMILRLRYEKDTISVISLTKGLLKLHNGSGLNAIRILLGNETLHENLRYLALESLKLIPNYPGDQASFPEKWNALLTCEASWDTTQSIYPATKSSHQAEYSGDVTLTEDAEAEWWKMSLRLRSQPLRPVDEARFVLQRMGKESYPLLLQVAKDNNRYVREHALQIMDWIGEPFGRWLLDKPNIWKEFFTTGIQDPTTRARAIVTLGAMGLKESYKIIAPWLMEGTREEQTASADALLRSGIPTSFLPQIEECLSKNQKMAPEGIFSLRLLLNPQANAPKELDTAEAERRRYWLNQRWSS